MSRFIRGWLGWADAPVLLYTGLERLADIDDWSEHAAGTQKGVHLLAELDELVDHLQASIIKDVEQQEG
jgi:hypothetical protein